MNTLTKKNKYLTFLSLFCVISTMIVYFVAQSFLSIFISYAGRPTLDTLYTKSTIYIAGNENHSADETTAPALFTQSGINASVLIDLISMINDSKVWGNKSLNENAPTYFNAKDFSNYSNVATYSQIVVKLFDGQDLGSITTTVDGQVVDISQATQQFWQVVYRSIDDNLDVLTLYMTRPFAETSFNAKKYENEEGNLQVYEGSNLQDAVVKTWNQIVNTYSNINLSRYAISPSEIPGQWQVDTAQPGNSYSHRNGLLGNSLYDELWVPSAYEVQDVDEEDVATISALTNSNTIDPEEKYWGVDGRTGLWELNAYDRAWGECNETVHAWLRSGSTMYPLQQRVVTNDGDSYRREIYLDEGVGIRVAIHLDIKAMLEDCNISQASVSYQGDACNVPTLTVNNVELENACIKANDENSEFLLATTYDEGAVGGLKSITNLNTGIETPITFIDNNSLRASNGVADIVVLNTGNGEIQYSISNIELGNYQFNIDYHIPKYSTTLNISATNTTDVLLIISSNEGQVILYKVQANSGSVNILMPNLMVGSTYKIAVINGTIGGTLQEEGGATIEQNTYTFVCNTDNATITLSGITIS